MVLLYDLLRSTRADDFGVAAACLLSDAEGASATDAGTPAAGARSTTSPAPEPLPLRGGAAGSSVRRRAARGRSCP